MCAGYLVGCGWWGGWRVVGVLALVSGFWLGSGSGVGVSGGWLRGGTPVTLCVLGHVGNRVGNHVDWLWTACGKVLVHTGNSHVHTGYPHVHTGWVCRVMAAEGGVIHISTGIYYLLPGYLSFGVIAPYGARACGGVRFFWTRRPCKRRCRPNGNPPASEYRVRGVRPSVRLSVALRGGFCEGGHGGPADELDVSCCAVSVLGD